MPIRRWLVPTMSDISLIEFIPTAPTEVFTHDRGTSSIDEWQMWASTGDTPPTPPGDRAPAPPECSWPSQPMLAPPASEALHAWLDAPVADRGPLGPCEPSETSTQGTRRS